MPEPELLVILLVLGAIVGLMAGLLGIGGGGIMVPVLTSIFIALEFSKETIVHIALGTSMASIIVTSIASLRAHHTHRGVIWHIVRQMSWGVIIGALVGTFLASYLNTLHLAVFFAVFMAYVSLQMFLNKQPRPSRQIPGWVGLSFTSLGIGGISSLVAIGGGSLTVPFLVWSNIDMRKAIGTSAALGFPIAVAGALGYLIVGWRQTVGYDFVVGYIYWPAVIVISSMSFITAPLGARLAHSLPVPLLKKIFALFLVGLSAKMLFSII